MNIEDLKKYLSHEYQGSQSFLENIIYPIFGEEEFVDGYEAEILDNYPEYRKMADATGIRSVKDVGMVYIDGEPLQIFDISVSDRIMMERNRVTIQSLVRRIMDQYSNAFMLFHYEDISQWNWRFTYCHKSANKEESTDSKRYTFLLGPKQSCRTAAENFVKLYEKRDNLMLLDIEDAFSVEALSDRFFNEYKEKYANIIFYITGKRMVKKGNKWEEVNEGQACRKILDEFSEFDDPEKAVRDYVKKLMGRLVFLQFLQKKGWLGVPSNKDWGEGDGEFIQHLFTNYDDQDNFIDDVLEKLFNDLNTERKDDISKIKILGYKFKVPYLNGGLFERDATDEAEFPLPAEYMQSLLEFFSRYNFTIDENDPDDAEVGVDPEMLGRIFENLLEDNKDKGAFYTPKEIVTYMCRESLIAYLQTDIEDEATKEALRQFVTTHDVTTLGTNAKFRQQVDDALKDVKICDPAIGSGAFPMGLLKELFLCRTALESIEQNKAAEIKKHIIQQNIYGVDIEKGAVDIARLRFWLSLIVDEKTPHALPNLDFKIMQGNSLLENYEGIDLSDIMKAGSSEGQFLFADEFGVNKALVQEHIWHYYNVTDHIEKERLSNQIDKAIKNIIIANNPTIKKQIEEIEIRRNQQFFLWHLFFAEVFEKGGFNVVIGNPPYVSAPSQIANPVLAKQRERIVKSKKYETLNEKWDLYIPFMELGLKLLAPNGVFSMIVPYPLTNQKYGKKLRKYICEKKRMTEIADVSEVKVFDSATVANCIPFIINTTPNNDIRISHADKQLNIKVDYHKTTKDIIQDEKNYVWNFTEETRTGKRFPNLHVLGDFCYISVGMVLNADERTAKGEFVKDDLINSFKDNIHSREYIEAKDIDKYIIKRVRYLEWNTSRCPDKLRRPTFRKLYDCPKLMMNCLGTVNATIDISNHYLHNHSIYCAVLWKDLHHVTNKSITSSIKKFCNNQNRYDLEVLSSQVGLYYLLGILNSRIAGILLADQRGGDYHIYPEHIRNIPIPIASDELQEEIGNYTKQILDAKAKSLSVDTSAIESKIDLLVYHLYGLTYDEVLIVDPETPITREEYDSYK